MGWPGRQWGMGTAAETVDAESGNVRYADVDASHRRGLEYLAEILYMILGHFHDSDNPDHVAARAQFLAPLMEHDQQARIDHRTRRGRAAGDDEGEDDDETAPDDLTEPESGEDPFVAYDAAL